VNDPYKVNISAWDVIPVEQKKKEELKAKTENTEKGSNLLIHRKSFPFK
jgi:hypothetical protein